MYAESFCSKRHIIRGLCLTPEKLQPSLTSCFIQTLEQVALDVSALSLLHIYTVVVENTIRNEIPQYSKAGL